MVETTILYMSTRKNLAQVLNEFGAPVQGGHQAIAARVTQEFAAKRKHRRRRCLLSKPNPAP